MFTKQNAKALGRTGGKQSGKRDLLTQHIIAELGEIDPVREVTKARALVMALIDKAIAGDVTAANAIMDRVEGKPVQINENYNVAARASEMSDDELVAIIADGVASPVQH